MARPSATGMRAFRARRNHLARRAPRGALAEVAGDVCGLQSQVLSASELGLWSRVAGLRDGDLAMALSEQRTLVRTWAMRCTVHLLPSGELPMYMAALRGSAERANLRWLRTDERPVAWLRRLADAIVDVLGDGPLDREALADRVVAIVGERARPLVEHSWGGAIRLATADGRVCFGPSRGPKVTFVRTERWLGRQGEWSGNDALDELVRRYLRAHGPATQQDFRYWSGTNAHESGDAWARVAGELAEVEALGRRAYVLREDRDELDARPPRGWGGPRLLPNFDGFLLAQRDKSHLVDSRHYKRVYRRAGWIYPAILAAGRCVGTWSQRLAGGGRTVVLEPFGRLTAAQREGVAAEVRRLAAFYGRPVGARYARGRLTPAPRRAR